MLQSYIEAGFSPTEFWTLSPRLYLIHMLGARSRMQREHSDRAWLAWHAAYLPNLKKPIGLRELISGEKQTKRDWQDQLAAWQAFANYKAS
jgi:hypothetical protein